MHRRDGYENIQMLRASKGKVMKQRENLKIAILFLLLMFLNPQLYSVRHPASQNSDGFLVSATEDLQFESYNEDEQINVTLWIKDWAGKIAFSGLNVTIFDLASGEKISIPSNETGYVELDNLLAGLYAVLVQSGNRTVGYQKINVSETETVEIRTWAYDLNVTLLDEAGKPLANHTVFLYDQMVFQAPNYTLVGDEVIREANYTVMTDEIGLLVGQNETDVNGTVHFTGLWNGTYRIRVLSKELKIEKYILGKKVIIVENATRGDYVFDLNESTSLRLKCVKADLRLKLISESNNPIVNATVYVRDRKGHLHYKGHTNETGFFERQNIYVMDDEYVVSAIYGNRTVGYEVINATRNELFTVKGWAYNLTVKCVDQENKPLQDHIVFLYDQTIFQSPTNFTILTNQTGILLNWTKTDENGTAYFTDLWNGTYKIRVLAGRIVGEKFLDIQEPTSITLKCNKTYLKINFITRSGEPLSNATVRIYDSNGRLVFLDLTDQDGQIYHESIYVDNYTVFVEWAGINVWSGDINTYIDKELKIVCPIFRLTIKVVDPSGKPLPRSEVILRRITATRFLGPPLKLRTDDRGQVSHLLYSGTYEIYASSGIYSSSTRINLVDNRVEILRSNVQFNVLSLILLLSSPLIGLTLLLERRRLSRSLEIRRYKNMLLKLESLYESGLVEYKLYRKLRERYEAKLMELGGREVR